MGKLTLNDKRKMLNLNKKEIPNEVVRTFDLKKRHSLQKQAVRKCKQDQDMILKHFEVL